MPAMAKRKKIYIKPIGIILAADDPEGCAAPLGGGPLRFLAVRQFTAEISEDGQIKVIGDTKITASRFKLLAEQAAQEGDLRPLQIWENLTRCRYRLHPDIGRRPLIMGVLNATPDSFSDGGLYAAAENAVVRGEAMIAEGADILDIGGESTRPGAALVPADEEWARIGPVIAQLHTRHPRMEISIDSRKAVVMDAAVKQGASILNDVSGLTFDSASIEVAVRTDRPVVIMHAQGRPDVMQDNPSYGNALLEIYDWLEERIEWCVEQGVGRHNIIIDPGVGFGKKIEHNLELLSHIALFHGLGCPLLVGVSRKKFIGTLTGLDQPRDRLFGSIGGAVWLASQGVQILRVHDVAPTVQALTVWRSMMTAGMED